MLDIGSCWSRVGRGGEDAPIDVNRTLVGHPKEKWVKRGRLAKKDILIGNTAIQKRNMYDLNAPTKEGVVNSWDDMEAIWKTSLSTQEGEKEGGGAVLSVSPLSSKEFKAKTAEILFENVELSHLYLGVDAILTAFCHGTMSALVIDFGYHSTRFVPVKKGCYDPKAVECIPVGGAALTESLLNVLNAQGHSMDTFAEKEMVKEMKRNVLYVAKDDFEEELSKVKESESAKTYTFPDGKTLSLEDVHRVGIPETIFKKDPTGKKGLTFQSVLRDSIAEHFTVTTAGERVWAATVHSAGGSSLIPGMDERLAFELNAIKGGTGKIPASKSRRDISAWLGGSILSTLSGATSMFVTSKEYAECGPSIVQKKCSNEAAPKGK